MSNPTINLTAYLSSLITPTTSILAIHHLDQPLPAASVQPYYSPPLVLLKYLATTIMTTHSLSHVIAEKAAADRSVAMPTFGLGEVLADGEPVEGVLQGLGSNDVRGIVVAMEARRKSGRSVGARFVLEPQKATQTKKSPVVLLEEHPLYQRTVLVDSRTAATDDVDVTFNLGLTEQQRRDREGVVLPYFDAQNEDGVGEGGRILYDMGEEDDFDEEEDEI